MTQDIEERLRNTLATVARGVAAEDRWDRVVADAGPASRDHLADNRGWSLAAIAAVVLIAAGFVTVVALGRDGEQVTVAAGADFVLAGEVVLNDDPLTVVPAPAPEPAFDTSGLGTEIAFDPIDQVDDEIAGLIATAISTASLDGPRQTTKVILAGRVRGQPWIIVVADGPNTNEIGGGGPDENLRHKIVASLNGASGSGDLVPYDSLEMIELPGVDESPRTQGAGFSVPTGWLEWSDLPAETAVVTFSDSDQQLWMRPRAGLVAFETQFDNGERFDLTAYDAAGTVIRTYSETIRYDNDTGRDAIRVGDQLDAIRGTDQRGQPVRIGPDGRLTALIFGADWCQPCQSGLPETLRLVEALDPAIAIYAVPHYTSDPWPTDPQWPYLQLSLETDSLLRSVNELPTVIVLDSQNTVLLIETGIEESSADALATLQRQLAPAPSE